MEKEMLVKAEQFVRRFDQVESYWKELVIPSLDLRRELE